MAEELRARTPSRVPLALQPAEFRRLLYPFPYQETILAQGRIRGVEPALLIALIREESRFDTSRLSPASSRGLTHLSLGTARRLAASSSWRAPHPRRPLPAPRSRSPSARLHLGALLKDFSGSLVPAVPAYGAGEPQAILWRNQCFSQEPEELFTKIGTARPATTSAGSWRRGSSIGA